MKPFPRAIPPAVLLLAALFAGPLLAIAAPPSAGASDGESLIGASGAPFGITYAGGRVFVADFGHDRVEVRGRSGETILAWGTTGTGPGEFRGPAGIAVGPDGSVFVTDHYNNRVQRFTDAGEYLSEWSTESPMGIAADASGRLYVTDLEGGRVTVWSPAGGRLATWGTPGAGRGELEQPWGIAVDARGDVLVADHGNHRVQRFSDNGRWLDSWGGTGTGRGAMLGPMGIAIGRDEIVYVSEISRAGARAFAPNGEPVARWDVLDAEPGARTTGLAVDEHGELLLAVPDMQRVTRLATGGIVAPEQAPSAFALLPVAQPLGRGPVVLELAVPGPGAVRAEFFSLEGRRIHTVPRIHPGAGVHRITWDGLTDDGHRAPVGVYFARVHYEDGKNSITRGARVIMLR